MAHGRVLITGATGHFGRLLVDDLRRYTDCELVVASRSTADVSSAASLEAALGGITIAICAAGPFQDLPTTLAEICIRRGVHYIDLADARGFVKRIHSLASEQNARRSAICSAWSTASALSGLLTGIAAEGIDDILDIYIHMAPGNRVPRGAGTITSLLHSVGQKIVVCRGGLSKTVRGWSEPRPFVFPPPIGTRRGYLVDVPDHELFPPLFRAQGVEFRTASELAVLNGGLSVLGWFVRAGLVRSLVGWSRALQRSAAVFGLFGHDWGGIGVEVIGTNGHRRASIMARSGGQRIAVMPASVMAGLLSSGSVHNGLVSPAGWLTRERLQEECEKRAFQLTVETL